MVSPFFASIFPLFPQRRLILRLHVERNVNKNILRENLRACLHGSEGPLVGEVTQAT